MTVLKKLNSADKLLGLTKLFWKEGHMVLPLRLIHASEAALAEAASKATGAAMAATLMASDVSIVVCVAMRGEDVGVLIVSQEQQTWSIEERGRYKTGR